MKRGILFTISLVMIVSVVLALAILIFNESKTTKDRLAESGSLDRLSSTSNSIALGFKEIFNAYSGINIIASPQNVTFEEFLPNNNATKFKDNLDNYKNYIESQDKTIILNISKLKNQLPLIILPHNITYKHNSFGGNQIIINRDQLNLNKYFVDIKPDFNVTACSWSTFPGNLTFQLKIDNPSCDNTVNLDPTQNNLVDVNSGSILIKINNSLYIENNVGSAKVKTIINLNQIMYERTNIWSDKNVININYQDLNISKKSGFRIV